MMTPPRRAEARGRGRRLSVEVGERQRRWPLYSPLMAIDKSAEKNADAERRPLILSSAGVRRPRSAGA